MKIEREIGFISLIAEENSDYILICALSDFFDIKIKYHSVNKKYRIDISETELLEKMLFKHKINDTK
jgi:hypothetical protein